MLFLAIYVLIYIRNSFNIINIKKKQFIQLFVLLFLVCSVLLVTLALSQPYIGNLKSKAAEMSLSQNITTAQGSGQDSIVQNLILPTVLGSQTNAFTGDAQVSYPISLPKGVGGLMPSLGLSYSSASVADFAVGTQLPGRGGGNHTASKASRYFQQAGQFGFGWNLGGVDSISKIRDAKDSNLITYILTLSGTSYKLISNGDGTWGTSPNSNLKISHIGCKYDHVAQDTGSWQITDTSGTWYVFGAESGERCTLLRSGNQHLSTAWRFKFYPNNEYSNLEPYKWMIRLIRDIHGNEIHYDYTQEWKDIETCSEDNQYPMNLIDGSTVNNGFYKYTTAVYLDSITYGDDKEFQVRINYENRPDWKIEYGGTSEIPAYLYACNQNYYSKKRADQITVTKNGNQYALYDLGYTENANHFSNNDGDGDSHGHSMLTSIKRFGTTTSQSLPATKYVYTSSVPNEVLIRSIDNGNGGKVTYAFNQKPLRRCKIDNANNCVDHSRWAVATQETEDQITGKTYTISYEYDNGLAMYLTDECQEGDCNSFDGYEFLGYGKVLQKTSKNNSADPAQITRSTFYQANQSGSCINPSAKKGQTSVVEILNKNGTLTDGAILSKTTTSYKAIPFQEPACDPSKTGFLAQKLPKTVMQDVTKTQDGVTTKVAYEYDQYGNTTKVINHGFSAGGDERYTLTYYATDKSGKNLISKPHTVISSKDASGRKLLSIVKTYYDNSSTLGEIPSGGRGLPTKTETGVKRKNNNSSEDMALEDVANEAEVLGVSSADNTYSFPKSATFSSSTMKYDEWGNMVEVVDPRGAVTTTIYDYATHTLPERVIRPKINKKRWETVTTYDETLGKPITITDINGVTTHIDYDTLGRVKKIWGPNESKKKPAINVSYGDEKPVWVKTETLTDKNIPSYTSTVAYYNGLGQNIENQTQWDNNQTKVDYTSYTSLGQVDYTVLPFLIAGHPGNFIHDNRVKNPSDDKKTVIDYDKLGRQIKVSSPDETEVSTVFSGITTTSYDANDPGKTGHNKKVTTVDAYGQTIKTEEYKNDTLYITSRFEYDKAGRLVKIIDPGNHETKYSYNILGQKVKETNVDSGTILYAYDEMGNLIGKKDNKNQIITISYDSLSRIKKRLYPDGTAVMYSYDEGSKQKGKLTRVSYNGNTSTYSYDIEGNLIKEEKKIAGDSSIYITDYAYDDANRLSKITYPIDLNNNRETTTQTYTISQLPDKLTTTVGNIIESSAYNVNGQLTDRSFGNNTTLSQKYYDANFRLKNITLKSGNSPLLIYNYAYDNVGNIKSITDNLVASKTLSYTYDDIYRLTDTAGGYKAHYEYDSDGNIKIKNEDQAITETYSLTDTVAVHAPKTVNSKQLTYDLNGNLTDDSFSNQKILYDFENKPVEIRKLDTGALLAKYYYDGEGRRVKKEVYTDGALAKTTEYINQYYEKEIPVSGQPVVRKFYAGTAYRENNTLTYITQDHLATTNLLTTNTGAKSAEYQYYPYGNPVQPSTSLPPKSWIGQIRDDESGLYFLNARYYSPTYAKFISVDPETDPSSRGNNFLYAANNPVGTSDPLGTCVAAACDPEPGSDSLGGSIESDEASNGSIDGKSFYDICKEDIFCSSNISMIMNEFKNIPIYLRQGEYLDAVLASLPFLPGGNAKGMMTVQIKNFGILRKFKGIFENGPSTLKYIAEKTSGRVAAAEMLERWQKKGLEIVFMTAEEEKNAFANWAKRVAEGGGVTAELGRLNDGTIGGAVEWGGAHPVLKVPRKGLQPGAALHEIVHVRDWFKYDGSLTPEIREITEANAYAVTDFFMNNMIANMYDNAVKAGANVLRNPWMQR